jgi:type I restriction enzyme S subunit
MVHRTLPVDWEWTTVGEAGKTITGTTPPKSDVKNYGDFIPFIKPPELNDGSLWKSEDNLSEEGAQLARVVPEKAVLVSCIGNLGKTGIAKGPIAFNQQINAIVFPENVLPEFGFYYFQSTEFRKQLEDVASATTISIVNKSKFNSLSFPFAPLPEQERIVSRIEELFSDLDAGVAALEKVQVGLKRYRASVHKFYLPE